MKGDLIGLSVQGSAQLVITLLQCYRFEIVLDLRRVLFLTCRASSISCIAGDCYSTFCGFSFGSYLTFCFCWENLLGSSGRDCPMLVSSMLDSISILLILRM